MGGDQDRASLLPELQKQLSHQLFGAHVHTIERFIQQQHISPLGNGPGQEGALALAARKRGDRPVSQLKQVHPLEGIAYGDAIAAARNPKRMARLIETVRQRGVPAVFCESTVSDKAQRQVAEATGARFAGTFYVDSLSNSDGPASTLLDLQRHNVKLIRDGLAGGKG